MLPQHDRWDVKPSGYADGAIPLPGTEGLAADMSGASQQTRHARRIYVGGLADVTEAEIADFFSNLVRK